MYEDTEHFTGRASHLIKLKLKLAFLYKHIKISTVSIIWLNISPNT